jgi:tripartite-type tricarboxylate transporter receptor subunit TctC
MLRSLARLFFVAILTLNVGLNCASAQVSEQAYKGKQIRMVIAGGVGGGYDFYARLLSQYLPRHIPGNPTIVNQNMPGGAGMIATNWGAKIAPKDGSVIIATYHVLLFEPLFGNPAAEYSPPDLEWIGSIAKQQSICMTWYTSKIKTIDDAKRNVVTVSSTGTSGATYTIPLLLNSLLHTKFKVISGYQTAESRLAVERGEVDGMCGMSWSTLKAASPDWVSEHKMNLLVQTGNSPQEDLPAVPLLLNFVRDASDKKVLSLISAPDDMGRPFFMPPGTDKALVQIVRRAFDETMTDPEFLADAKKQMLEIAPISGERLRTMLVDAYQTPSQLVERAKAFMK